MKQSTKSLICVIITPAVAAAVLVLMAAAVLWLTEIADVRETQHMTCLGGHQEDINTWLRNPYVCHKEDWKSVNDWLYVQTETERERERGAHWDDYSAAPIHCPSDTNTCSELLLPAWICHWIAQTGAQQSCYFPNCLLQVVCDDCYHAYNAGLLETHTDH